MHTFNFNTPYLDGRPNWDEKDELRGIAKKLKKGPCTKEFSLVFETYCLRENSRECTIRKNLLETCQKKEKAVSAEEFDKVMRVVDQ